MARPVAATRARQSSQGGVHAPAVHNAARDRKKQFVTEGLNQTFELGITLSSMDVPSPSPGDNAGAAPSAASPDALDTRQRLLHAEFAFHRMGGFQQNPRRFAPQHIGG